MGLVKGNFDLILLGSKEDLLISRSFWPRKPITTHPSSITPINATTCLSTETPLTRSASSDMKLAMKGQFLVKYNTCPVLVDSMDNPLTATPSKIAKGRDLCNAWWKRCR